MYNNLIHLDITNAHRSLNLLTNKCLLQFESTQINRKLKCLVQFWEFACSQLVGTVYFLLE